MEPKIVFEDEEILVLEKPAGMVVNRAESVKEKTLQEWLEKNFQFSIFNFQLLRSGIVHRLDKETSGLLLVAKTPVAFMELQRQFKERIVKKRYLALVHGKVVPEEGEISVPVGRLPWNRERFGVLPGGREAVTKYKVLSCWTHPSAIFSASDSLAMKRSSANPPLVARKGSTQKLDGRAHPVFTLLELSPQTGRTHQIRIHLKYLNHPIIGDEFYAGRKTAREDRLWCPRLFLHAAYLGFYHPTTKEWLEFESELPEDLKLVIDKIKND